MFYDVLRTCSHPEDPNAHRFQWPRESEESSHRGRDLLFRSALIFQLMFKSVPASAMFSTRLSAPRLITELICYHFLQLFSLGWLMTQTGQCVEKPVTQSLWCGPRSTLVWAKKKICVSWIAWRCWMACLFDLQHSLNTLSDKVAV